MCPATVVSSDICVGIHEVTAAKKETAESVWMARGVRVPSPDKSAATGRSTTLIADWQCSRVNQLHLRGHYRPNRQQWLAAMTGWGIAAAATSAYI